MLRGRGKGGGGTVLGIILIGVFLLMICTSVGIRFMRQSGGKDKERVKQRERQRTSLFERQQEREEKRIEEEKRRIMEMEEAVRKRKVEWEREEREREREEERVTLTTGDWYHTSFNRQIYLERERERERQREKENEEDTYKAATPLVIPDSLGRVTVLSDDFRDFDIPTKKWRTFRFVNFHKMGGDSLKLNVIFENHFLAQTNLFCLPVNRTMSKGIIQDLVIGDEYCSPRCPHAPTTMEGVPTIIMVRDPLDLILDGYFYHVWCSEEWTEIDYCKKLQGLTVEKGISFEMNTTGLRTMTSLLRHISCYGAQNNVLFIRYEDILRDERFFDMTVDWLKNRLYFQSELNREEWGKIGKEYFSKRHEVSKRVLKKKRKSDKKIPLLQLTDTGITAAKSVLAQNSRHGPSSVWENHKSLWTEKHRKLFKYLNYDQISQQFGYSLTKRKL